MACLKKSDLLLYMNKELSKEGMRNAMAHLVGCDNCREAIEKLDDSQQLVFQKLALLEPARIPPLSFEPMGKETSRYVWPNFFPLAGAQFRLRAAVVVVVSLLFILPLVFLFLVPRDGVPSRGGENMGAPGPANGFYIHSISTYEKPARPYIVKDKKEKITFIWVENKSKIKEV